MFQPLDARGRWLCQIGVPEEQWSTDIFNKERCIQWIRDASGVPDLEVDVQSIGKWQMNALVCETFVRGNVAFMGDAAQMMPPTGGLGVNTGIQGMHNMVWKLALHLRGKAGRALLDTYTAERRPYSTWVAEQSLHNSRQVAKIGMISKGLAPADMDAEEIFRKTKRYGNHFGLELGAVYSSIAVVPDGSEPPNVGDPYSEYVATGRPGHRAPHVWLRKGEDTGLSTIDLWGPELTLLSGPDGGSWKEAVKLAGSSVGFEVSAYIIGADLTDYEGTFLERYGIDKDGAVLVRPDGFVAWRSKEVVAGDASTLKSALGRILALDGMSGKANI